MNTDDTGREIPKSFLLLADTCPKCGCKKFELRNYSAIWHDGDIHCAACGTFIRSFDAG